MRILYGTIENADAQAKQRIRDYRTAAEICPKVADIINAFDNKVYNSRFDKALAKNTDNRVHVEKRYGGIIRIYTFPEHGYSFDITLATQQITDMPDGKRLSADKLLASLEENSTAILEKARLIEQEMYHMMEARAKVQSDIDAIDDYLRSIPDDLREIYGLPYSVRPY